jgi:tetratricopeptide (TPR) repeat protein
LSLARHFEEGGVLLHAAEYLLVAGRRATSLYAHTQAKALYDRCLALVQQVPPSPERIQFEIEVQLARAAPLFGLEGLGGPEATRAANRAVELMEQLGPDSPDSARLLALYFLTSYLTAQNHIPEALAHTELLLKQAAALGERVYAVLAYETAGQVNLIAGRVFEAAGHLEKAIDHYRPEDEGFLAGVTGYSVLHACLIWDAWAQWLLGHINRSEELRQQAIVRSQTIEQARRLSVPLRGPIAIAGAQLSAVQNEIDRAAHYAEECLGLPDTGGNRIIRAFGEVTMGWVQVRRGDFAAGLSLLRQGIEDWQQSWALTTPPVNSMLLADALSLAGQTEQALVIVASLESTLEQTGRRVLEAHLHWLWGEIIVRERHRSGSAWRPDLSPALCFEHSIEVAQQQRAKSLELRATVSLARLLSEMGSPGEAVARLEGVLQHFDDDATTTDLRDARELLATLSAAA